MDSMVDQNQGDLFDLVMDDAINFPAIESQVLETAMSTMTQSMGK